MARGRKPKGEFTDKRATLSTRITPALRQRLDEACARTGRSLSQEVELRLHESFRADHAAGGPAGDGDDDALLRLVGATTSAIQIITGKPWHRDGYTFDHTVAALNRILEVFRPAGDAAASDFPGLTPGLRLIFARRHAADFGDEIARLILEGLASAPLIDRHDLRQRARITQHVAGFLAGQLTDGEFLARLSELKAPGET